MRDLFANTIRAWYNMSVSEPGEAVKHYSIQEGMKLENKALCITVEEMGKRLSISRVSAYALAHSQGFPTVTLGRRLLIPLAGLEKWLETQAGKADGRTV